MSEEDKVTQDTDPEPTKSSSFAVTIDRIGESRAVVTETEFPPDFNKEEIINDGVIVARLLTDDGKTLTIFPIAGLPENSEVGTRVILSITTTRGEQKEQNREPLRKAITTLLSRDHYPVNSSNTYQALREALALNTFERSDESPWPTARLDKGNTAGFAQLRPTAADTLLPVEQEAALTNSMWKQREQLSDLDTDALDALSAVWLHQAKSEKDDAVVEVDDLLRLRGLVPKRSGQGRHGGYRPEQRTEMLCAVSRVMNLWLNVAQVEYQESGRKRKAVTETIQSRPFLMSDRMGQLHLDGNMDVRRFIFRPGRVFSSYLLGPGRTVALLSAKALRYNPYTQPYEKRLAKYLSWQWKIRAHSETYMQPFKVGTLLEATCLPLNQKQPSKTSARLVNVLDTLQDDGVLANWEYKDWDEGKDEGTRGWASKWLDANVLIEPPEVVREHYNNHYRQFDQPNTKRSPAPTEALGVRLKLYRKTHGISQMRAAEAVGISQGYLSQLEKGREVKMSAKTRRKIETWIVQ
jgi:DNA-binding XRE family transcriptional regulator